MMEIYEFNMMDDLDKWDTLWQEGVFLMTRKKGDIKLNLYQLGEFYVEVRYDALNNVIERLRTFKTLALLEDYLDEIKIPEI